MSFLKFKSEYDKNPIIQMDLKHPLIKEHTKDIITELSKIKNGVLVFETYPGVDLDILKSEIMDKLHPNKIINIEDYAKSENEIDQMLDTPPKPERVDKKKKSKHSNERTVVQPNRDGKKTMIVSNSQTIVSSEQNIDPTNMIYEDVNVDPEFTKTTSQSSSPNSIEYYIEKPKMFNPLEPSFDALVAYVRELPQVVTKLDDEKITFYVDRKPFLVLMNYGNYYRMAFKYDLEKGIRLIIKYPTISKNKGTREELWFKANNYGDLPKEVVYQIVKSSYDSVNL